MSIVQSILQKYDVPEIRKTEFLGGAGGFSGAQIWKLKTSDQNYCLRRWPLSHPDRQRLKWIHLVLVHASSNGCSFVATPMETNSGERFAHQDDYLWELTPWMPGKAEFEQDPNSVRLENVMTCLAKFHLASAQVNLDFQKSTNAASRLATLREAGSLIEQIERSAETELASVHHLRTMVLRQGAKRAAELAGLIAPFVDQVFPVQPVIRDVWHDHVLFSGNEVTGMVDFGAMQMDNVALDLSRLLGSLVGNQSHRWQTAIDHYSKLRPLNPNETEFVFALDQCATFLGSLSWLKWLLIDRRCFESSEQVEKRVRH